MHEELDCERQEREELETKIHQCISREGVERAKIVDELRHVQRTCAGFGSSVPRQQIQPFARTRFADSPNFASREHDESTKCSGSTRWRPFTPPGQSRAMNPGQTPGMHARNSIPPGSSSHALSPRGSQKNLLQVDNMSQLSSTTTYTPRLHSPASVRASPIVSSAREASSNSTSQPPKREPSCPVYRAQLQPNSPATRHSGAHSSFGLTGAQPMLPQSRVTVGGGSPTSIQRQIGSVREFSTNKAVLRLSSFDNMSPGR